MLIITACRDFARRLACCLTERHDGDLSFTVPEAALARCRIMRRVPR